MSIQSIEPEVYQYAPQAYTSFNATPIFPKQSPNIQMRPTTQFTNLTPSFTPSEPRPYLPINPNNHLSSFPPIRPFQQISSQPLIINSQPEVVVDYRLLQADAQSNVSVAVASDDKYEDYLYDGREEYKYNIFSFADEPWNRCLNGDGCGKMPGNECIAKPNSKKYWN